MANGHAKRSSQTLANEARTEAIRRLQQGHREEYDTLHGGEAAKSKPSRVARDVLAMTEEERATLWKILSGVPSDPEDSRHQETGGLHGA